MSKRKILTLALTIAMAAILAIGGTLAYFTDTDSATNTFTFGNVKIIQREGQRTEGDRTAFKDGAPDINNSKLEEFENNQNVFPAVFSKLSPKEDITVNGYTFGIRRSEGNYIDKIVNVYNNGTEEAYMRTIIAVPNMNGYDDSADATDNPLHWNYLDATDFNGVGWNWSGDKYGSATKQLDKVSNVIINDKSYDIYVATYNTAVEPKSWTSPSMVGFYLDESIDYDDKGYFFTDKEGKHYLNDWMKVGQDGKVTLDFLVATQACQTAGFDDAWEALDECFGDITANNHPWA